MNWVKRLASRAPTGFGLLVTLFFIGALITSTVLANRWPLETPGWYLAGTAGRVISIVIVLLLLLRLARLRSGGVIHAGRWQTWLVVLFSFVYAAAVSTYSMTGRLDLAFTGQLLPPTVTLFIMTHALLEEVTFRGLILGAFAKGWGTTTTGLVRSVLISSLLFAAMHLINLLSGNPVPVVLWQSVGAFFLGIWLGALRLSGSGIPALALLHAAMNLVAYLNLSVNPAAGSAPAAWMMQSLLMMPLAITGLYLLRGRRQWSAAPLPV
jgi:membrane protease YdiL (CAAX protease family)